MLVEGTLVLLAAIALYSYINRLLSYWERRGLYAHVIAKENARHYVQTAYTDFRSKKMKHGGLTVWLKSIYLPVDLDLIKTMLIKDFEHFPNHFGYINQEADPLTGHLFNMRDENWRKLRAQLTPTFTSGKMKMMFQTVVDTTSRLVNVVNENMSSPINIKDLVGRLTTDIIGSIGFGIDCNSLQDPNCDFRRYGKIAAGVNWRMRMTLYIPLKLLNMINFKLNDKEIIDFFTNITKNVINYRESSNIYRKDFMHLLLQIKNRGKVSDDGKIMDGGTIGHNLSLTELTAQAFVFFAAGFETSSTMMTYTLFELSRQQDIQDKVREEMKRVIKKHGGITYEAINEMTYFDMVCKESLRKYPPIFITNRMCTKDYQVPGTDVVVEKGTPVLIPIYQIQNDPEYFPDPQKFDPERFSPENKSSRHPFTFLAFGEGPRLCIGERFGLLQAKVGMTAILSNFRVSPGNKLEMPLKFQNHFLVLASQEEIYLNFTKLND